MSDKKTSTSIISLPKGGGAVAGIGETFSPDLHTGTANFSVPIAVPPGRNGFQPDLNLVYSSGNGNGPFGQGWGLSVPAITRKTSKGVPKFDDVHDPFLMSSTEELVLVKKSETEFYYRPRTEGFFGQIIHLVGGIDNYWQVHNKEGLVSTFGTKSSIGNDPAVVANPAAPRRIFAWKQTSIEDPFGNRIEYEYERDGGNEGPHHWDQVYLKQIRYADFDGPLGRQFLITVDFVYGDRPDPYSEYRSGFEIRTRKRCAQIVIRSHAETEQIIWTYDLCYLDERSELSNDGPPNSRLAPNR